MNKIIRLKFKKKLEEIKKCFKIKNNRIWCPKKKWYVSECPFENRRECDNYQDMCGKL